jgi:hypothetical protein
MSLSVVNIKRSFHGPLTYPSIAYYNFSIVDNRIVDEGLDRVPLARFNEQRSDYIIPDASHYFFSIMRISLNGPQRLLPCLLPRIQIGQSNIDLTAYSISQQLDVAYLVGGVNLTNTFYATENIIYQTSSSNANTPLPPLTQVDLNSNYYYVYEYQQMVNMVNTTFVTLLANLQAQFAVWWTANGGVGPAPALQTQALKMTYDPNTKLFSINADTYGWGEADSITTTTSNVNTGENFRLFFNSNMYGLFSYWPGFLDLGGDVANTNTMGRTDYSYEIKIFNDLGRNIYRPTTTTVIAPTATPSYFVMTQNKMSTDVIWNPISSIVFTTSLIPIANELSAAPIVYGQSNTNKSVQTTDGFSPIITDISIGMENGAMSYNEFLQYVPQAEYRLTELIGSGPVQQIDIQVYARERLTGQLLPLELFNGTNIECKLAFFHKSLYEIE